MTCYRLPVLAIVVAFVFAGATAAQNAAPTLGGFTQPAPQAQQDPPCFADFAKLKTAAEKRAGELRAASQRKASPQEACKLFNAYLAAEEKMLKFVRENTTWCGIPPEVLTQLQTAHTGASNMRTRVCEAAAHPPIDARPTLSDAFGTSVPSARNVKSGRGTYDTLTGNPLGTR